MRQFAKVLRLIQLSDCHVARDPRADYRGQNADRNLSSLLPAIRRWQPDLLLLTGDVSEDASPASYGRVSAMLNSLGAPVLALPGNHDDPDVMQRYFRQGPWQGPLASGKKGWQLVLLDSTRQGKVDGILSRRTLDRLDSLLGNSDSGHILVALHHQPVPVNAAWIDRYALKFPEEFFKVIARHDKVKCIVWGHVHQDFQSSRDAVQLLGSPSSVANSLPEKEKFTLDLHGPSCRWLELHADGSVETGCLKASP